MTPPEPNEARARMLFAACGFGVAALAAVAVLLALGLRDADPAASLCAPARPATASSSAGRDQARRTAARRSSALAAEVPKGQLFAPTSVWNQRVPSTTALDPNSGVLVAALVAEVQREHAAAIGPWIGVGSGSTPVYPSSARTAARQSPPRKHGASRRPGPAARLRLGAAAAHDAKPAPGTDRHLTVWQPSTDRLWEFFGARHAAEWMARTMGWRDPSCFQEPGLLHPRRVAGRHAQIGGRRRAACP